MSPYEDTPHPGVTPVRSREIQMSPTTPRITRLRDLYFRTLSSVSVEFPYWYTRRYRELDGELPVVRRAEALKCAFSRITTTIVPGEKIIGGKTLYYRGSFPMPWLSEGYFTANEDALTSTPSQSTDKSCRDNTGVGADSLAQFGTGGGNVTKSFASVVSIAGKFGIRAEEVKPLVKLAHEWTGKSVEDLGKAWEAMIPDHDIKKQVMKSLVCMFDSGYTLPQGREVANYAFPLRHGYDGLIDQARVRRGETAGHADGDGLVGMDRLYFYDAMIRVLEGIRTWHLNYAKEAHRLAGMTTDAGQRSEYETHAECLEWIAHNPPRTFREALQMVFLIHIAILNEDAISGLSPGRLGQVLYPWFERDLAAGRTTEVEVVELLEAYRIKMTGIDCLASIGVIGGVLSGNTFNNVCLGGQTAGGKSATNRLETLFLKAGMTCETPQPTLTVLYDEKLSDEFLLKAIECNKTGSGYPAWVNNRNAIEFLLRQYGPEGMTVEEARAVAIGGCLETSPCAWFPVTVDGKEYRIPGGAGQPTSIGVHFIANPKVLELVLMDGYDHRLGRQVLPQHGSKLGTFDEVWKTFIEYYEKIVDVLVRANNIQHDIWRKINIPVFHSLLKPDCMENGRHIGHLGYRYNATFNIESCGQVNTINALAALKKIVYIEKSFTLEQMREAMLANFGYMSARETGTYSLADQKKRADGGPATFDLLHGACQRAPKFGNDDPFVDEIMQKYETWFCRMCRSFESLYGKSMYACQISVSTHGAQGAATLATPDGRLAGTTYADGSVSAYPGTDRNGPYALFSSATCWDHTESQNSQLNLKLHPDAVRGVEGSKKLLELTRAYLRNGGFHIQYNIVDSRMLRDAQAHPEKYRDLLVRVAGFTQYWVEIGKPIQDEVIARTEYECV